MGRKGSSGLSAGGSSSTPNKYNYNKLFTPPASGKMTRAQYDSELKRLSDALRKADTVAKRNKVYSAMERLDGVKVIS